jgi:hypothetical protein
MTARAVRIALTILLLCGAVCAIPVPAQTAHHRQPALPAKKGINILWRNPGRVESLDMAHGVGGTAKSPKAPFYFIEEDKSGSNPKIKVRDVRGKEWSLKWGDEAKPEVFASRLAWVCGYIAQPEYFVPNGKIVGVKRSTTRLSEPGN